MKHEKWVVVAKVADSAAAKRTDSCGDMEQLEMMEFILVSEHGTKSAAQQDAAARRARKDGWKYSVVSRRSYESSVRTSKPEAA